MSNATLQRAAGGGVAGDAPGGVLYYKASDFDLVETNAAPLVQTSGTNVKHLVRAFDDTTEEFVNFTFGVPDNIDTSGTVTFRVWMYSATAAASRNVALTFGNVPTGDSDDFDVAYTNIASGDLPIDSTQDNITIASWTETVATLGWVVNDVVQARVSRTTATTNLVGDLNMIGFRVEIPGA